MDDIHPIIEVILALGDGALLGASGPSVEPEGLEVLLQVPHLFLRGKTGRKGRWERWESVHGGFIACRVACSSIAARLDLNIPPRRASLMYTCDDHLLSRLEGDKRRTLPPESSPGATSSCLYHYSSKEYIQ